MLYLKHPAWLWLKKYDKTKLPPVDDNLQAIFDTGHEFEQYAESLFPGGITLGFDDYQSYLSLPERTNEAIDRGEKTIFQGRFEYNGLTFICDIIDIVDEGVIDLFEIKSSTNAKPEHEADLAFQLVVLEGCGYEVRNIAVIHVNNQYARNGDINAKQITATTDITEAVKDRRDETKERTTEALNLLKSNNKAHPPNFSPTLSNSSSFREWLEVYNYMHPPSDNSIYQLCSLNASLLQKFDADGIEDITDIPDQYELKPKQALQVASAKSGKPIIQTQEIKDFLDTLEYPLYFLDYETMSSLVPYFDGMRPYQQVPFQYSLHVIDSPGTEARHLEYLHQDHSNPAPAVAESLKDHIGDSGSIITWNMSFEKGCNDTMASLAPDYTEFLQDVNDRIVDLMLPFSRLCYVDAAFRGSASIKAVLPVLAPELSYKNLDIQEGSAAQRIWMQTILDGNNEHDREKILNNLIKYCELDTLAMVKIHQKLLAITH